MPNKTWVVLLPLHRIRRVDYTLQRDIVNDKVAVLVIWHGGFSSEFDEEFCDTGWWEYSGAWEDAEIVLF